MGFYIKRLSIFLVFLSFLLIHAEVFAYAKIDLPNTVINPDKFLIYSLKRSFEKALLVTKFNKNSKADYYYDLTQTRMSELKYVIENSLLGEIERSTQRVSYQVGILSDFIQNDEELETRKKSTAEALGNYRSLLVELRDKYSYGSSYWMLIQHVINSIDLNLEKLK